MKFILVVLMTVGLMFVTACPELGNSAAAPNVNNLTPTPEVYGTPQKKSGESTSEIAVFDLILTPYEKKQKKIYDEVFSFYGWAKIKKARNST